MLSEKRRGEIALLMLRARFEENGMQLRPDSIKEDIKDISKKTGIPEAEVAEFMEEIATKLVDRAFSRG